MYLEQISVKGSLSEMQYLFFDIKIFCSCISFKLLCTQYSFVCRIENLSFYTSAMLATRNCGEHIYLNIECIDVNHICTDKCH